MKVTKQEFKKLQQYWYKRLEQEGFKDIEKAQEIAHEQNFLKEYQSLNSIYRHTKEDYFRLLNQAIHDENTQFRNHIDKYILTRYAEGARIKTIVQELLNLGMSRDRYSVRIIIRKYEMAWNIKTYTRKQLHLKDVEK